MIIWIMKIFFVQSSVYSCHLFLISSASVTSTIFVLYWAQLCRNVPMVSLIFLKIPLGFPILFSSVQFSHSVVSDSLRYPILLLSSVSLHWPVRKVFLSLLAILWNSALKWIYLSFSALLFASLLFTAICMASSDSHFAFLHFFFLGMVLLPLYCTMSWASLHSSSGTSSIRSSSLNLFLTFTV